MYLLQHTKSETTFNFVSVNEVYIDNVINKLKDKSSYGYHTISNKHIKYARNVLTRPLTLLINQCIHTGIYPEQLKLSLVKSLQMQNRRQTHNFEIRDQLHCCLHYVRSLKNR